MAATNKVLPMMEGGVIPLNISGVKQVELVQFLGGGSFGAVWQVRATDTGKLFALKIIQNVQPGVPAERVRLEAEVSIGSKYIVPVVGLCQWDACTFLILFEYFAGRSLDKWLAHPKFSREQRQTVFAQVLQGVADAHRSNVIHRDLKPANILVNDRLEVRLIDFGVSKFKGHDITLDGCIIGTFAYMAPEFLTPDGAKNADARSDIYSLGQLFYEIVTGARFWEYKNWDMKSFIAYLRHNPPPTEIIELDNFDPGFYPNAAQVLVKMTKIAPHLRYPSVTQILAELGLYQPPEPLTVAVLDYPMLIIESGTNRNARTLLNIADGAQAIYGRTDFAGNDDSISRQHLEFRRQGNSYAVRDLQSKNGTLLAGLKLAPRAWHQLNHADRIKVGDIFLRFAFMQQP